MSERIINGTLVRDGIRHYSVRIAANARVA
jgi:hypothetical protein